MKTLKTCLKQILLISPEPWSGNFVSKHHYAITLASMGHRVYFLNPPDNSLSKLKIDNTKYKNLYSITAPQLLKGLRFIPKIISIYIENRWLEKLEKHIGSKFTTIWLFENSRFYNMQFAKDRLKIYHQVDSNQNFHLKEASSSADICFCVTDYILEDLLNYNKKVFKISHGVNLAIKPLPLTKEEKNRFNNSINVTYIGNLDMLYIDEDILFKITKRYSNITFHFIGNYSLDGKLYQICKNSKNIIWWGRIDSTLIPSILKQIDICLLTYRAEKYKKQLASPHKILEYLYSGKVIVATYTDEYKDRRELLEMVDNSQEYLNKFESIVDNLDFYNSVEKQQVRIDFAKNNSYEKQLEEIFFLIQENYLKEI